MIYYLEDAVSKLKNKTIKVNQEIITVLFICLDIFEKMIKNISNNIEEKFEINERIEKLNERIEKLNEYQDI